MKSAIDLAEVTFLLIAAEAWKKFKREERERITVLMDLAYEHLLAERWGTAQQVSRFVSEDPAANEDIRLRAKVNCWQSLKWLGRYEEIRAEIQAADFSAKDKIFQLARFVLMDEFDVVFGILPKILESGGLTREQLASWPIFREIRKDPRCAPMLVPATPPPDNEEPPRPGAPPPETVH